MYSHRAWALPLLNIYHLILVLRGNSPLLLFDDYVLSKSVMHVTIILQWIYMPFWWFHFLNLSVCLKENFLATEFLLKREWDLPLVKQWIMGKG
jgi:hypothetical protein